MENISVTFRHCYSSLFLHHSQRRYRFNRSLACFSVDIKHASFESLPISVSLEPSSPSWDLLSHGDFHPLKELNGCKNLISVKATHARMMRLFDRFDLEFVARRLISRYLEFGVFGYASTIFFLGFPRNQVSWRDFSEEVENFGLEKYRVLEDFVQLQNRGVEFDGVVLAMVLRICTVLMNPFLGFTIHGGLIKRGVDNSDTRVVSALMGFYGRCVSSDVANKIFDEMPKRDDLAWNEITMVNLRSGKWDKAVKLFREMQFSAAKAYDRTMVKLLQVCSHKEGLAEGRQIHGYVLRLGFETNISVCNSLIVMYSRNGKLESSRKVFNSMKDRNLSSWNSIVSSHTAFGYVDDAMTLLDKMERCNLKPDIVTWNSLLSGYAFKGLYKGAIAILKRMQIAGLKPNTSSISSLLQAVAEPGLLKLGKAIHGYVIRNQLWYDLYVETTLIDMYVKTGCLPYARMVFDKMDEKNIVAWNSLISGLSYAGLLKDAEALMIKMEKEGNKPDAVTWNNLVSGYATWGKTEKALAVIGKMKKNGVAPNVVSWTAILSGCSKNGNFGNALKIFIKMQEEGVCPNSATISTLLRILGCLSLVYSGKEVHSFCLKNNLIRDAYVATALVDMYTKSGDLRSASEVFWSIENKPLASWNCMIMGYAMFGQGKEGIAVFNRMLEAGMEPDAITFTSVLSVCKNSGLVSEGWKYFDLMMSHYGFFPTLEHCSCMVDMLGRSGYLDEAWDFIQTMPIKPDATIWGAFLSSCKIHRDLELAEVAWKRLQVLEPHNSANYMMMINLYSSLDRWEDVEHIRDSMRNQRVKVQDLWSWIQIDQTVHVFYAEGKAHPDEGEIYFELYKLVSEMKKSGYVPDTSCIHSNVSEPEKERLLMGHTEKLAITYGLIKKKGLAPIRVVKNTSICSDCHTVAKYISILRNRDIVLHEGSRVHHFRDGKCSCNDSWL
ncbi:pentatricopeptide repeat-containing protein At4g01030, mitochondrial [Eutrema salsugineum]|uniref:pentatricopeptide repeat-containing protein At4g01030, mitochondrial n=1 Tax=Eutrema salsugineum TaxID=72664 RepID=UPI000CED0CD0|nr:pentatricopeptide repeat-containing protein At4g01030, mitochondrial [Eutrema salsugineum]